MVGDVLATLGHAVEVHDNGADALVALGATDYDLVITDLRMPDIDGQQLSERAEALRPGLSRRFLFLTGDTLSPLAKRFLVDGNRPHLDKPITPEELRRAVSQAISALVQGAAADPASSAADATQIPAPGRPGPGSAGPA